MTFPLEKTYCINDIYALPDGQRAELIDGQIYDMAPLNFIHQKLVSKFNTKIENFITDHRGDCQVLPAPFAVFLNNDSYTYVEPDLSVICDRSKLDDKGCNGAPDWVIEITSPSTASRDYGAKLFKYRSAGVREYWIVNPKTRIVNVFDFEHDIAAAQYSFDEAISGYIFAELSIRVADLLA